MSTPVLVYLPINTLIDPSGVQVFGETVTTSDKIIKLANPVPAADLAAFMQYMENPANRDLSVVSVKTAASAEGAALATDLSGSVNGNAQCDLSGSGTQWWSNLINTDQNSAMNNHNSLGEVLLSQIAYDLFGHPLAKAGIANDTQILEYIRVNDPGSALVSSIVTASADNGLNVVFQQILHQAPDRFGAQDSSGGVQPSVTPANSLPVNMPFQAGDHVRFEVTLNSYTVTSFNNSAQDPNAGGYSVNKALFNSSAGLSTHVYTVDVMLS